MPVTDRLHANDIPRIGQLLAAALHDDPAYGYVFPDARIRPQALAHMFRGNLRVHLSHRCSFVARDAGGSPAGTVTVRPPGGVHVGFGTMLRAGLIPFVLRRGRAVFERLMRLKARYDALERELGEGRPYWHVHMMAITPEQQGAGHGSLLLRDALAPCMDSPQRVVLTTHTERNVCFYRRAGFEVAFETHVALPGAVPWTVWGMRRKL